MASAVELRDRKYLSMIPKDEITVSSSVMVSVTFIDLNEPMPAEVNVMMHRHQARRLAAHILTALAEED